jgi:hypothetical protein
VTVLEAPLSPVGVGDQAMSFGGVLGGDLLQAFSLELRYGAACTPPTVAFQPAELACSCEVADACGATLAFTLAGGGTLALGGDLRTYPATRVTVDACLEPVRDPVARGVACIDDSGGTLTGTHQRGYEPDAPPGVDVRLLVATGFEGVLLGASAYDRLRGRGAAAALLAAGNLVPLRFASHPDPLMAARATLGGAAPSSAPDGGAPGGGAPDGGAPPPPPPASLVLVGREGLLGACGELARSRRLRWRAPLSNARAGMLEGRQTGDDDVFAPDCGSNPSVPDRKSCLVRVDGGVCGDPDRCNDVDQPAAAVVELDDPLPIYVVDDGASILQEVNFDIGSQLPSVEGVIGTEVLARLETRIDYPNGRLIARCAAGASGCTVYPRYVCPDQVADCGPRGGNASDLCNAPSEIPRFTTAADLCLGAPVDRR